MTVYECIQFGFAKKVRLTWPSRNFLPKDSSYKATFCKQPFACQIHQTWHLNDDDDDGWNLIGTRRPVVSPIKLITCRENAVFGLNARMQQPQRSEQILWFSKGFHCLSFCPPWFVQRMLSECSLPPLLDERTRRVLESANSRYFLKSKALLASKLTPRKGTAQKVNLLCAPSDAWTHHLFRRSMTVVWNEESFLLFHWSLTRCCAQIIVTSIADTEFIFGSFADFSKFISASIESEISEHKHSCSFQCACRLFLRVWQTKERRLKASKNRNRRPLPQNKIHLQSKMLKHPIKGSDN